MIRLDFVSSQRAVICQLSVRFLCTAPPSTGGRLHIHVPSVNRVKSLPGTTKKLMTQINHHEDREKKIKAQPSVDKHEHKSARV